jgi:hypothetical protein
MKREEFLTKLSVAGLYCASPILFPVLKDKELSKKALESVPAGNFVDMHQHFGMRMSGDINSNFDSLLKRMDENSVAQAVLLSVIRYPLESPGVKNPAEGNPSSEPKSTNTITNEELLEKISGSAKRLFPFIMIHPDTFDKSQQIVKVLKQFKKKGVIGFGELKPSDAKGGPIPVDDQRMMRLYTACAEVDFPVLLHIDAQFASDEVGLPRMEKVLKEFPDVVFIGHAAGWWNAISGDSKQMLKYENGPVVAGGAAVRLLDKYPNMYADLSAKSGLNAIQRDIQFGSKFLVDFSDKLMFGTDGMQNHYGFYNQIDLPGEIKSKILRENARKILKLT